MTLAGDIKDEIGRTLRAARQARGMTLRDAGIASEGRFKPTAVAGYERSERAISVERFCELAELYGMAPDRLLSQVTWRVARGPEPSIDRRRVDDLPARERDTLDGFIQQVRRLRGAAGDGTITLRIHDLEVLATVTGSRLGDFLDRLGPALVRSETDS